MNDAFVKGYAVIRADWLGNNILKSYFPFISTIIIQEKWDCIDEEILKNRLEERYEIPFSIPFLRQVLGEAVKNRMIVYNMGRYEPDFKVLKKYKIDEHLFDSRWNHLVNAFLRFLKGKYSIKTKEVEDRIIEYIDNQDEHVLLNSFSSQSSSDINKFEYHWCKFLLYSQEHDIECFNFVVQLCAANLVKNALFYTSGDTSSFKGLCVYIDTPMIFSLLGVNGKARQESYSLLISKIVDAGCNVRVFKHNYYEVQGILNSSTTWALSPSYDMRKANNATKFFHDSCMSEQDILEFIKDVETKLNSLNITLIDANYDMLGDKFQEDEEKLFNMIKQKYDEGKAKDIETYNDSTIRIDVRSSIMVYRKRAGNISTEIQSSKHIMITSNGSLAHVCKNYEMLQNPESGHVPTCITADLFGTILWLYSPAVMIDYQKKRILGDCFAAIQPSKRMIEAYIKSIEKARESGDITEQKFLFMRAHPIVREKLMDVTEGDYAQFHDYTWQEVYKTIEKDAKRESDLKLLAEIKSHDVTRKILHTQEEIINGLKSTTDIQQGEIQNLKGELDTLKFQIESEKQNKFNKKCNIIGMVIFIVLIAIPYIIGAVLIEIYKNTIILTACSIIYLGIMGWVFSRVRLKVIQLVKKAYLYFHDRSSKEKKTEKVSYIEKQASQGE